MNRTRLAAQWLTAAGAILLLLVAPGYAARSNDTVYAEPSSVRLGVLIVVDQMRADYLDRFHSEFTGGLARLLRQGTMYSNAYHDHAGTETAPGHATISTGRFPSHSGIVGNDWYDREAQKMVYCCEDSSAPILGNPATTGRSPRRLLEDAMADWLKTAYPKSMVYSVALKDRAAILMGGKHANGAFWYDRTSGRFVTSAYYMQSYPVWLDSFNSSGTVDRFYREGWSRLLPDSAYSLSHEDNFPSENDGKHTTFPHPFDTAAGAPDKGYYSALYGTPFADELTLMTAKMIVSATGLGRDSIPDLLCIGCSAADAIGHTYGPNSQEVQDYYLRLDRYLDTLFTFLDTAVGTQNYCVALTSDHGVLPLPEDLVRQGVASSRLGVDSVRRSIMSIGDQLKTERGFQINPIIQADYDVRLSYVDSRQSGLSDQDFQQIVAARIRRLPFIADAFTRDELQSGSAEGRPYFDEYRNSFHPLRGPDIYLRFPEFVLVGSSPYGTSHGSPYAYDTDVPIVFLSPRAPATHSNERVRTVDVAPTLAHLLGVAPPKGIDGTPLKEIVPVNR